MIANFIGFVEAGEISGGPLDDESPQQRAANTRVFKSLDQKLSKVRQQANAK